MKYTARKIVKQGLFFMIATIVGNVLNLVFNFYLGRTLSPVNFGLVALFMGIVYVVNVFFSAILITTSHAIGISRPYSKRDHFTYFSKLEDNRFVVDLLSIVWVVALPFYQYGKLIP
jgi:O-antigen/teichoic acid export membrane protein